MLRGRVERTYKEWTGNLSALGTGMETATASLSDNGAVSFGFNTGGSQDTVSITSYFSYTDSSLATYASNDSATDSYAVYQAGRMALGSLSLSSTTFQDQNNECYSLSAIMSESYAGRGTLTQAGTSTSNAQSSYGYTGSADTTTSVFNSIDTFNYSSLASTSAGETAVLSSSYYGAGSYGFGDYNLSSVLYQSAGCSTDTLTAAGSDSYAGAGSSYMTITGTGSGNGQYNYGSFTDNGNGTTTSFNSYTLSGSDSFASTETAVASFTSYEAGTYASWISPPKVGIDNKPGDFEYVKIET